ncbi:hypothetical protein [Nevskia sp.]|uniref:hypothetical protein n=1 Tax=Nevskia sp. TaxID=1929292 RepID=UPI0025E27A2C|nr:hypothetical protein [Nevskia sp.]
MLKKPFHFWLLALTFAVGQWLAVVHGTQHALNSGDQLVACEVCVAGHASAGPPNADLPVALLPLRIELPTRALPQPRRDAPALLPPPRGPPIPLA